MMTETKIGRYWRVLADGDEVHVTAGHGEDRSKHDYYLWSSAQGGLAKFKAMVERLPADYGVNVTLIMCCDSEERGGADLLELLERHAEEKDLSITTEHYDGTTAEAVDAMQFAEWWRDDRNVMKALRDLERRGLFVSELGDNGKLYFRRTEKVALDDELDEPIPEEKLM
jgi:hypothetical protein